MPSDPVKVCEASTIVFFQCAVVRVGLRRDHFVLFFANNARINQPESRWQRQSNGPVHNITGHYYKHSIEL